MADAQDTDDSIRLVAPTTEDEWRQADTLITELKEWDVQQSQALGFGREEVLSVFYPADFAETRRDSARPEGCFLLALDKGVPAGCAAFRRLTRDTCELYDLYVRPAYRGRGAGSLLLRQLIAEARSAGYQTLCLETATFMHAAHRLYLSLHFRFRDPYRSISARYTNVTLWMELGLN